MQTMIITIPARVFEAIQEGDQLRMHQHAGKFSASLKDCNDRGFYAPMATTAQQALENLNRELPVTLQELNSEPVQEMLNADGPTMQEIALMDAQPERGQP